jgi:proline racemase
MAPTFLPAVLEHLKQHLTLWYLNQMDGYTSAALDRPFNIMKVEPIIREAQQLLAAAGQHVHQDANEQLADIGPMIQQALETLQKMKAQQPLDPSIQALVQTQMAETQRKTAKDQADAQIKQQDMVAENEGKAAELQARVLMNTEDNLTEERIKAAELTRDAAALQQEQIQTAIEAQNRIQSNLGV